MLSASINVSLCGPRPAALAAARPQAKELRVTNSNNTAAAGRTRWRRFAAVMGVSAVVAGGLVFGMANGAVAASFSISGQQFKVGAEHLHGDGFAQFSGLDLTADGKTAIPVASSYIQSATLTKMCQSVDVTSKLLPFKIVLRIEAGGGKDAPATATDLLIGMTELSGDATFKKMTIGADGQQVSGNAALAGTFAQKADSVDIDNLQQKAYSTTAGTFVLKGLNMKVLTGANAVECF
jgi:hypothetical protein